jgi:hypothetical protein
MSIFRRHSGEGRNPVLTRRAKHSKPFLSCVAHVMFNWIPAFAEKLYNSEAGQ